MKLTKKDLMLEEGLKKEWVITNGIGGFASSSVLGANTRRYHGLLIAPLDEPAKRHLIVSKLDESLEDETGKETIFYTNVGKDYITRGDHYLVSFEKEIVPKFTYQVEDCLIQKTIVMEQGKNTVYIGYHIQNGKQKRKLKLAPILNFRDFHSMMTGHQFHLEQSEEGTKVTIIVDDNQDFPIYMNASEGTYIEHTNDMFYHMYYIEEMERGFYPEENHVVSGHYEIEIEPEEEKEITVCFSLEKQIEKPDYLKILQKEEKRIDKILEQANLADKTEKDNLLNLLVIASDQFVIKRKKQKLTSVIAGYPWFLDWGRDTLIAFEGLFLVTKRQKEAKEVLKMFTKDIKCGLVPNGYSEETDEPLYNSADASLLLFEQVKKYAEATNDEVFVQKTMYPILKKIVEEYSKGIDLDDNNIHLEKDGLLSSGTPHTQNTWMDAKIHDFAVTPRNGKAVEINSLWYNALKIMEEFSKKYETEKVELQETYQKMAEKCKKSFKKEFYCEKTHCLYDVVGDSKIRPNQLFALSLSYPVIDPNSKIAKEMMQVVEKKLLKKYGIMTLAKGEDGFVSVYEGDSFKRDMSYHQGISWTWLLGLYEKALKNQTQDCKNKKEKEKLQEKYTKWLEEERKTFEKEVKTRGCIGSIAELYDAKAPYMPKGAFAQAWSVAEVLRILARQKEGAKE